MLGLGEKSGVSFLGNSKAGLGVYISPTKNRSPNMATASLTERKGLDVSMVERWLTAAAAASSSSISRKVMNINGVVINDLSIYWRRCVGQYNGILEFSLLTSQNFRGIN